MSHPDYKHIGKPEVRCVEEVGEFLLALGKAQRFGWFSYHPEKPSETNMDAVRREMADVVEAFEKLEIKMRELSKQYYSEQN